MSLLLSLFTPKTLNASRSRRDNEPKHYTEMGVFNRGCGEGTELVEISSALPRPPASRERSKENVHLSVPNEVSRRGTAVDVAVQPVFPPVEVSFVWEVISKGSSVGASLLVQDALERLCWSGSVLCKLLSSALPGSLDERAINWSEDGFELTGDDALENFQMCHSCAQAQGCDVQGLTVDRLAACEASILSDFVLEILRLSSVQVLRAPDRQYLEGRMYVRPGSGHGTLEATGGTASTSSLRSQDGRDAGGPRGLRIDVGSNDASSSVVVDTIHKAARGDRISDHSRPGLLPLPGTAAARRAMLGLESWALQLAGGTSAKPELDSTPDALSAPTTPSQAHSASPGQMAAQGPQLQLSPAPGASATRTGHGVPFPGFAFGTLGQSINKLSSESGDVMPASRTFVASGGSVPAVVTAAAKASGPGLRAGATESTGQAEGCSRGSQTESEDGPDPLGLAAWEYLVQRLSGPSGCGDDTMAPTSVPDALRSGEVGEQNCPDRSPSLASEASADSQVAAPYAAINTKEDMRWDAAAQSLSKALAFSACYGSPLPLLRAEHLQCRHPGLRSLLLARALVAYSQRRDGILPCAATAVTAASSVAVETACSDDDSGSIGSSEHLPGSNEISPDRLAGSTSGSTSVENRWEDASATATTAGAATAAAKLLPASPAPPLPPLRKSSSAGDSAARRHHTVGGRAPMDVLSEHNMLVQQEHQQREIRRQQQEQQHHRSTGGERPRANAAVMKPVGEGPVGLWSGDGDDVDGEDQEERVLRLWLNSLDPGIHVMSLFEQEVTTGWPLLQALHAIQPGCVPWSDTFRPPFKEKLRKILSVQNCNLVIEVCTRQLAMPPLVNIGGLDLALGQRRATLSLVFQMMRHHMGMLLGLAAPQPLSQLPPLPRYSITGAPGLQHQQHQLAYSHSFGHGQWHGQDASPHMAQPTPYTPSPHRGTRAHLEVEKAVLAWANTKLLDAAAAAAAAAAPTADGMNAAGTAATSVANVPSTGLGLVAPQLPFTPLASFSDKRLGEGRVLLQLLAAICPRSVNPKYVLPGRNAEERGSNARYLLSCARKLSCVIFLAWEDLVVARPNLLLLLLASFMALDRKKAGESATGTAAGASASITTSSHGSCVLTATVLSTPQQ